MNGTIIESNKKIKEWFTAGKTEDFPKDSGIAVKYMDTQIAVFYFSETNKWYATQNQCPHKLEMALSRGIIGSKDEEPKVSCPFHKKSFSLKSGKCLSGDNYEISTYPVKIEDDHVLIGISE